MRKFVRLGAVMSISLLAAGCGGGSDDKDSGKAGASNSGGTGQTLQIDVKPGELKFAEENLTAKAGTITLRSENPDALEHNIAVDGNGASEEGDLVKDGAVSEITVDLEAGEYEFYCTPHRVAGMKGTLTVT